MGKKKYKNFAVIQQENDINEHELTLAELQRDRLSRHRSCWRHFAAYLHGVHGKVTKKDMSEIKRFKYTSPCFLDSIPCRKRSKTRGKGLSRQRRKMDDITFDYHLENIWRGVSEEKRASFAHLGSMCFAHYQKESSKALKFVNKKDIFSKKYVFVPIVCWDHWRLVIFCHFGEAAPSKTRTRCILLLDSLQMSAHLIEPDVRKFVFDIFKAEGRPETKDVIYQIPLLVPKVPQQRNDVDCGRFVLYFIRLFMDAAPENFSISNGYPYFMNPNWFNSDNYNDFCNKLEKESPTHTHEIQASRRVSRRIKNTKVIEQSSPSGSIEVITVDDL